MYHDLFYNDIIKILLDGPDGTLQMSETSFIYLDHGLCIRQKRVRRNDKSLCGFLDTVSSGLITTENINKSSRILNLCFIEFGTVTLGIRINKKNPLASELTTGS